MDKQLGSKEGKEDKGRELEVLINFVGITVEVTKR